MACDLGAGCGIISFLWALGNGPARIDGVEMQQDGVELMTRSVDVNRLGYRIRPICADLRRYRPGQVYDLVACNPPYFKESAGTVSAEQGRRTARFEETATLEDVVRCIALRADDERVVDESSPSESMEAMAPSSANCSAIFFKASFMLFD